MAKRERYSIIKRLDKGGMAEVFLGKSASLEGFDKVVAIKRVLPDLAKNERFVNMFLDEAKISLHLDHANIVSVFDVGRSGQSYFIVMEFIDGTNMKRLIEGHAMPLDLACYVAVEVCKALVYAHEKLDSNGQPQHIVHRDISPPNILISRDGEVKLTDFGLARAASQLESTDPGVVKGKFAYLSPEASVGEEVDLRADIFALGVVLWESLAGRRLFQGQTDLETLQNVRACTVPPIHSVRHDIPASLDRILNRALAKNRADRYSSAREFGRELSRFLVQEGMSVTSYDLAAWIQERIDLPADVTRLSPSLVESAVQQELERFVGVKDDSKVIPNVAGDDGGKGRSNTAKFAFEDPRLWGLSDGEDIETEDSISQRLEDSPSGLLRIDQKPPAKKRHGTSRLGQPLTGDDFKPSKKGAPGLPPRTRPPRRPTTKTTAAAKRSVKPPTLPPSPKAPSSKGRKTAASALPPTTSKRPRGVKAPTKPPRSAKPAAPTSTKTVPGKTAAATKRPAPKRTMMMTPIDEAFFDALDGPESVSAPAAKPASPASTSAAKPAPAAATSAPAAEAPARKVTPAPSPAVQSPPPDAQAPAPAQEAPAAPPVQEESLEPAKQKPKRATPAPVEHAAPAAKAPRPWLSQLVTLIAFGAVVYFSYLILAPALM